VNLRNVTIARDDGGTVMLSSGVAQGERVALNLSSEVTEGQKVMVKVGGDAASQATTAALPKG
jgi:hypothetical protein